MSRRNRLRSGGLSLRTLGCLSVLLVVGAIVPAAVGQGPGSPGPTGGSRFAGNAGNGPGGPPSIFPIPLPKNLVSRFSLEQSYESGIRNGRYANESDTYREASASFVYKLSRKQAEYSVDYKGSARHYQRHSSLDVLSHDLGLSQIRQLSPRLSWNLNYRLSSTPDFNGGLLRESLAQDLSLVNPLPTANLIGPTTSLNPGIASVQAEFVNPLPSGVSLLPTTVDTLPQMLSPGDGLFALRSVRVTSHGSTKLNYDLNSHTSFFSDAGFQKTKYGDRALFGGANYSLSAGMRHLLSLRTKLGISYQAGRNELSDVRNQFTTQSLVISFDRQLTQNTFLTLVMGPSWTQGQSQETISLSPLLANLLGRPALHRDVAQTLPSWMGSMGVATLWHKLKLDFQYSRSISSSNGLGGTSLQLHYSAKVGRQLRRGTSFSLSVSYMQSDFLGVLDPVRLNQGALGGTFTHRLSSGLDFVAFVNYSKFLGGSQSLSLDHNQFGIRFQYHLPRLGQT